MPSLVPPPFADQAVGQRKSGGWVGPGRRALFSGRVLPDSWGPAALRRIGCACLPPSAAPRALFTRHEESIHEAMVSGPGPRYLTAYELTAPEVWESPAAHQARKTPWTEKMRSLFQNTRRSMCKLILPSVHHGQNR